MCPLGKRKGKRPQLKGISHHWVRERVKDPNLRGKPPKKGNQAKGKLYKEMEAHLKTHKDYFGVLSSVFGGGCLSPLEGW
jgi:hypothetical protein